MQRLVLSTRAFLTRTHCTGRDLARIVGSWTWAALVRRECLCVFRTVYRFRSVAGDRVFHIWPCIRQELTVMMGLAPLMYADLSATWCDRVFATDACTTGNGASTSLANTKQCQPLLVALLYHPLIHQKRHVHSWQWEWVFVHGSI